MKKKKILGLSLDLVSLKCHTLDRTWSLKEIVDPWEPDASQNVIYSTNKDIKICINI